VNNEFKIIKRGIANLNYFRIFNRWGNMVFETTNIDEGWDGTYKGVPQNIGVFVYQVQAVTQSGKIFTKQGNVTLLR
jgi:gliding motility-associated-like protein